MRLIKYLPLMTLPLLLYGQWSDDPFDNLWITSLGNSSPIVINADSNSIYLGYIHTPWNDTIPSAYPYIIKLNEHGEHVWQDPLYVGIDEDAVDNFEIIEDGIGGFYVTYVAKTFQERIGGHVLWDYQIRTNRFNQDGVPLWDTGVWVSSDTLNDEFNHFTISSGESGIFISWVEEYDANNSEHNGKRVIQYISGDGERQWGDSGIVLNEGNYLHPYGPFEIYNYDGDKLLVQKSDDFSSYQLAVYDQQGTLEWELPLRSNIKSEWIDVYDTTIVAFFRTIVDDITQTNLDFEIIQSGEHVLDEPVSLYENTSRYLAIQGVAQDAQTTTILWQPNTDDWLYPLSDSYFQQIDHEGTLVFDGFGRDISNIPFDSVSYRYAENLIPYGEGFYVTYVDDRTGDPMKYVNKYDHNGNALWVEAKAFTDMAWKQSDEVIIRGNDLVSIWRNTPAGYSGQLINDDGTLGGQHGSFINEYKQGFQVSLLQNYPNPFNLETIIPFELSKTTQVVISIFDIKGGLIWTYSNNFSKGAHNYHWRPTSNHSMRILNSGIYIYQIAIDGYDRVLTKKLILMK